MQPIDTTKALTLQDRLQQLADEQKIDMHKLQKIIDGLYKISKELDLN